MNPQNPRVIVPNTTVRDAVVAISCGLLILGFIGYGILHLSTGARQNTLTGKVVAKQFHPAPEEQISIGKKGLHSKSIDGEYLLEVRVDAENRTFEVPVDKTTYEARNVGDSQTFLRPPSEQK